MKWMVFVLCLVSSLVAIEPPVVGLPLDDRLSQLDPGDPAGYFRLGEDLVDAAESSADLELAIRLFVIADHLNPGMYRRSAILAIRPLVDDPTIHRLLKANLRASTTEVPFMPEKSDWSTRDRDAVMNAVDAVSAFRNGDERKFLKLLESDGVLEVLEAHSSRLPGDIDWMSRRLSRSNGRGADLAEDDQVTTLELQAELLGSSSQPWSVVLRTAQGRPMTVIDPIPLSEIFGIPAEQVRWVDGEWSRD